MIFGQQDTTQTGDDQTTMPTDVPYVAAITDDTSDNGTVDQPGMTSFDDVAAATDDQSPVLDQQPDMNEQASEAVYTPSIEPVAVDTAPAVSDDVSVGGDDDLLALKQQALSDLSPLVDQLEQTPEEKFRTTMMMIQSTDNQALIKEAYAAAQAIPDDKVRAQALLDVINEINYFTQPKE